jgi:cyclic pyranopterin phosphate synthase
MQHSEASGAICGPLLDPFGRVHTSLRVGVTDRCNIRCSYCMPLHARFRPRHEILTFEEIERFVRVVARLGVNRVRLTGGEPLVRHELPELVRKLAAIPGIVDLAMTTNGILLPEHARKLKEAGLQRLNISLDALGEAAFRQIARRENVQRVVAGILAAKECGFRAIRLNTVALRGVTEPEVIPLARFAREHDFELRFIEFMPLDGDENWREHQVLSGEEIRAMLSREYGELIPASRADPSQPAVDYEFPDGVGRVGFISSVTEPFCGDCSRLRLTAEGKVRNCLFATSDWDVRELLRSGAGDAEIAQQVRACVAAKKAGHGVDSPLYLIRPNRSMYQIGG